MTVFNTSDRTSARDPQNVGSRAGTGLRAVDLVVDVPGRRLLYGAHLEVPRGDCVVVAGRSGSGKTTLLHCLAGITTPDGGEVTIGGTALSDLGEGQRAAVRLRQIGMVFQFGDLIPELTVAENVELPLRLTGMKRPAAAERVRWSLTAVGLDGHEADFPATLSGGETQRAAVARAISGRPDVLIADEPTGSLDEANGEMITDLLLSLTAEHDLATVIATHDVSVMAKATRVLHLKEQSLVSE